MYVWCPLIYCKDRIDYALAQTILSVLLFYDAPTTPPGVFDDFLAIPNTTADVSARTFVDFMNLLGDGNLLPGPEGYVEHAF